MSALHRSEPDAEVGPEDRIRLDELLRELEDPENRDQAAPRLTGTR